MSEKFLRIHHEWMATTSSSSISFSQPASGPESCKGKWGLSGSDYLSTSFPTEKPSILGAIQGTESFELDIQVKPSLRGKFQC